MGMMLLVLLLVLMVPMLMVVIMVIKFPKMVVIWCARDGAGGADEYADGGCRC